MPLSMISISSSRQVDKKGEGVALNMNQGEYEHSLIGRCSVGDERERDEAHSAVSGSVNL